jgi:hypothetical protein
MRKVRLVAIASGLFWIAVAFGVLWVCARILSSVLPDWVPVMVAAAIGLFGVGSVLKGLFASNETLARVMKAGDHPDFQGFQNSGKQFDDAAKIEFARNIAEMLQMQKTMAGKSSIEDQTGCPKRKAIGYVYGYVDAALHSIGQDMADMSVGVPITYQVIRRLWPDRVNEYMDFIAKNMHSDELMNIGMMHGGQQFLDYHKPGVSDVPMGLARFMIEGD